MIIGTCESIGIIIIKSRIRPILLYMPTLHTKTVYLLAVIQNNEQMNVKPGFIANFIEIK